MKVQKVVKERPGYEYYCNYRLPECTMRVLKFEGDRYYNILPYYDAEQYAPELTITPVTEVDYEAWWERKAPLRFRDTKQFMKVCDSIIILLSYIQSDLNITIN